MRIIIKTSIVLVFLTLAAAVYIMYPPHYPLLKFPHDKKFAFTIVDDTDLSTLENIRPIYDFLDSLGFRTTKTVWVLPTNKPDNWANRGQTLADSAYRGYILDLQKRGFEIASHGARGGSSTRPEILQAMGNFKVTFGTYPKIFINHCLNQDDIYWGKNKFSFLPYRAIYALSSKITFNGEDSLSSFFWGDFVKQNVRYAVNFSFHDINVLKVNPLMPYYDADKKYINGWFQTSDCMNVAAFCKLLKKENVDRLEREHGVCIVYTHFGLKFCKNGVLDPCVREKLIDISSRDGWFAPAQEVLSFLEQQHGGPKTIGFRQKLRLETLWFFWEKFRYGST